MDSEAPILEAGVLRSHQLGGFTREDREAITSAGGCLKLLRIRANL
jgi:hypothetical protein